MRERYIVVPMDEGAQEALRIAEPTRFESLTPQAAFKEPGSFLLLCTRTPTDFPPLRDGAECLFVVTDQAAFLARWAEKTAACSAGILYAPPDPLPTLGIAKTLRRLETVLFANDEEKEIFLDKEDFTSVTLQGRQNSMISLQGTDLEEMVAKVLRSLATQNDPAGIHLLFELPESYPLLEISRIMERVEARLPQSDILFQTRIVAEDEPLGLTAIFSRYIPINDTLQAQLQNADTYLKKARLLAQYLRQNGDPDIARALALRYKLAWEDVVELAS